MWARRDSLFAGEGCSSPQGARKKSPEGRQFFQCTINVYCYYSLDLDERWFSSRSTTAITSKTPPLTLACCHQQNQGECEQTIDSLTRNYKTGEETILRQRIDQNCKMSVANNICPVTAVLFIEPRQELQSYKCSKTREALAYPRLFLQLVFYFNRLQPS